MLRMPSKCIDSTSGCKFVTGNGFSNSYFLYADKILVIRSLRLFAYLGEFYHLTAHTQIRSYFYFRLKI